MNRKVDVIIINESGDESGDENSSVEYSYSINKDGVIVIDDDSYSTSNVHGLYTDEDTSNKLNGEIRIPSDSNENQGNHSASTAIHSSLSKNRLLLPTKIFSPAHIKLALAKKSSNGKKSNHDLHSKLRKDGCSSDGKKGGQNIISTKVGQSKSESVNESAQVLLDSSSDRVGLGSLKKHLSNFRVTVKNGCCSTEVCKNAASQSTGKMRRTNSVPFLFPTSGKRKRRNNLETDNQNSSEANIHLTSRGCSANMGSNVHQTCSLGKRCRTLSAPSNTVLSGQASGSSSRQVLSNLQNSDIKRIPLGSLSKFSHILFIDLDNWKKFFELPYPLPSGVFVWGFCGGNYTSKKKMSTHFTALVHERRFYQHPKCGTTKNAADFALCVQAARLDLLLPMNIPFTVLSGDKGFGELKAQLDSSPRQIHLVDPHHQEPDILHAILSSIGQS